jgi:uncharacterized membrane protein YphA (DoxX/SURF4 family)
MMTSVFLALRWALAVVLMVAGAGKIGGAESLASSVRNYLIVPDRLVTPLARFLPAAEVALGVALAAGLLPAITGWFALAAFCTFAAAMAWNLSRGRSFDCGCGFTVDTPISWSLVGRNLILVALSAVVALGPSGGLAALPGASQPRSPAPTATALVAVPMIVLLVAVTVRLMGSIQPLQLQAGRPPSVGSAKADAGLSIVHVDGQNANNKGVI